MDPLTAMSGRPGVSGSCLRFSSLLDLRSSEWNSKVTVVFQGSTPISQAWEGEERTLNRNA
jgi:hypothetical protein